MKLIVEKDSDKDIVAMCHDFRYGDVIEVKIVDDILCIHFDDKDKIKEDITYYAIYPPKGEFEIIDSCPLKTEVKEFKLMTL